MEYSVCFLPKKWKTLFVYCPRKKVEYFVFLSEKKVEHFVCFLPEKSGILCSSISSLKRSPPQICHPAKCEDEVKKDCQTVEKDECKIENVVELVDK